MGLITVRDSEVFFCEKQAETTIKIFLSQELTVKGSLDLKYYSSLNFEVEFSCCQIKDVRSINETQLSS